MEAPQEAPQPADPIANGSLESLEKSAGAKSKSRAREKDTAAAAAAAAKRRCVSTACIACRRRKSKVRNLIMCRSYLYPSTQCATKGLDR